MEIPVHETHYKELFGQKGQTYLCCNGDLWYMNETVT